MLLEEGAGEGDRQEEGPKQNVTSAAGQGRDEAEDTAY